MFRLLERRVGQRLRSGAQLSGLGRMSTSIDASALTYPKPPTSNHHDLSSFLQYAERTELDPKSTVYIGTLYEYTVAASLAKYGFSLQRTGGSSDYGIDLLGAWSLPSAQLRVILQCKATSQKLSPHSARELEGAFVRAPVGWRGPSVLGLLVSEKPATKGVQEFLRRSRLPMGYVSCSRAGQVQQMLWNRRAEDEGLEGIGVGLQYPGDDDGTAQLVLTQGGRHLPWKESAQEPLVSVK